MGYIYGGVYVGCLYFGVHFGLIVLIGLTCIWVMRNVVLVSRARHLGFGHGLRGLAVWRSILINI